MRRIERKITAIICYGSGAFFFYHFCFALLTHKVPSLARYPSKVYWLNEDPGLYWANVVGIFIVVAVLLWVGYQISKQKSEWDE